MGSGASTSFEYGKDHEKLVAHAVELDKSQTNRTNIGFARLAQEVALHLLNASGLKDKDPKAKLEALEPLYAELAQQWNQPKEEKPGFAIIEGVKYAINAVKFGLIAEDAHVVLSVPFFKEFERGAPASTENPNGEESPIQKFEELVFLCGFNKKVSMHLIFVNDSVAEKVDKDPSSVALFKEAIAAYSKEKDLGEAVADFEHFELLDGQLCVSFTSVEAEAAKGSACESPEEKRKRMENRHPETNKLQERKGGAVLAGMEVPLGKGFADKPTRAVRILLDGDSTIAVGSFVGEAAHSILQEGNNCYLANMKHPCTCISYQPPEPGAEAAADDSATQARVQNRKLFFSGFTVPFLFPELSTKYKYMGTTQLPAKAFRGDIDFCQGKLPTVQPNVDLGCLALTVTTLNAGGGSIQSGPITIRDNVASSTMTTSDLQAEWDKTYGPIFVSAVGLARELKKAEFEQLPAWCTAFIERMKLKHYTTLFGNEKNEDVDALFADMKTFKGAADPAAVLEKLKGGLKKIFPDDIA
ncbi:unnamed protein product [Effrenium voratum]|nr:unnamed protein product [Effrenium voratum]|eukprot:CAMPEP_0181428394 /NCGR_PEP_ID=MMETSP1110-20121109/16656_1 /TAXON_ID=174948 /ORGANISM="Symbiodinium sp., Strain CCMP421" /LENGTH=527 /DNA_ID=CAMNT_0023551619 /DNA_START=32 /DNA_END=1615 /DNA_ORIENTATION=-